MTRISGFLYIILRLLGASGVVVAQDAQVPLPLTAEPTSLVVTYRLDSAPIQFKNADGEPDGILVDVWRLWSKKSNIPVRFVGAYSRETQSMVRDGTGDIIAGLFPNQRRAEFLDFSSSILSSPYHLYFNDELAGLSSVADLPNFRVGVTQGSFHEDYLREQFPNVKRVLFKGYQRLFEAAERGDISVFVTQPLYLSRFLTKNGFPNHYRHFEQPLYTRAYQAGVKKGRTELLENINFYMEKITDRERRAITRKWLGLEWTNDEAATLQLSVTEKQWLADHPAIRLGVDPDWPPFEFIDEQGRYRGIGADVITALSDPLGISMTPLPGLSWQAVMDKARHQEVDVLPAVRLTQERQEYLRFTEPYFVYPYVIFVRADSQFVTSLADLQGKPVAVEKSYATEDLLRRKHPGIVLRTYANTTEALYALSGGEVDAYVGNLNAASWVLDKLGMSDIKVAAPTPYNFEQRIGVRKDWPQLVGILNKAIAQVTPQQRQDIKNRWFAVRFEHTQTVDNRTLWRAVLITVLIVLPILGIILWWNRRLQREIQLRHETEAALRENEKQLKTILNNIPLSIVVASLNGEILIANPHAEQEIESADGTIVGRKMQEFYLHLEERDAVMQELSAHGQVRERTIAFRVDSGKILEGLLSVMLIKMGHQTVSLGILVNLTERMKMERDLATARDHAERANRSKSEFLSNMSHELRTPLNSIIGFTGILKDGIVGPVNEEQSKQLGMVYSSARHLLALINDILDLSKVEAGRVELVSEPFQLAPLLKELIALMQPLANAKGLVLRREGNCPDSLFTDRGKLRQILVNLLGNAIKFTDVGSVTLFCRQVDDGVVIEVSDTGIGIAESDQTRIFNTFEQADTRVTREYEGTGLGLAICQRFVDLLGGDIMVSRSVLGEGTVFRIRLPSVVAGRETPNVQHEDSTTGRV
ncbi:MAG: transporter substrate-binding domain-containing protein [Ectothiorhodospiraceae bacterium]|nr:transporter substrate-binding domain-containing protein [Ectothiorhodospiraceae bacterium]